MTSSFPLSLIQVSALINNYGFIFMRKKWLAALGWKKGMALKIERNPNGSVTGGRRREFIKSLEGKCDQKVC